MADSPYLSLKEFRDFGYLQEVNRQFFHPLGLALELMVDEDTGEVEFGGILDMRDVPGGIAVEEGHLSQEKGDNVAFEKVLRQTGRENLFGGAIIQPLPEEKYVYCPPIHQINWERD